MQAEPPPHDACKASNASSWLFRAVLHPLDQEFVHLLLWLVEYYRSGQLQHHLSDQAAQAVRALIARCFEEERPEPLCALFMSMLTNDEGLAELCRDQLAAEPETQRAFPVVLDFCAENLRLLASAPHTFTSSHMLWTAFYTRVLNTTAERDYESMRLFVAEARASEQAANAAGRKKDRARARPSEAVPDTPTQESDLSDVLTVYPESQ